MAGMIRLLWEVETNKTTLWVKWVRCKYIRGGSIWCTQSPQSTSWAWRSILQVRHLASTVFNYSPGNGENTLFFLDPWLNQQPLMVRVGDLRQDLACDVKCRASKFINNSHWTLPSATTIEMHDLWPGILCTPIRGDRDVITLTLDDGGFSLRSAWDAIRDHSPTLPRARFIWGGKTTPRKAFCTWRAFSRVLDSSFWADEDKFSFRVFITDRRSPTNLIPRTRWTRRSTPFRRLHTG